MTHTHAHIQPGWLAAAGGSMRRGGGKGSSAASRARQEAATAIREQQHQAERASGLGLGLSIISEMTARVELPPGCAPCACVCECGQIDLFHIFHQSARTYDTAVWADPLLAPLYNHTFKHQGIRHGQHSVLLLSHDCERLTGPVCCLHRLRRPPMRYDPEDLLHRSGMDSLGAMSFLHENYTSFIDEEAMEDVARCAAHLSDAGG